jgi:hypothetical protein
MSRWLPTRRQFLGYSGAALAAAACDAVPGGQPSGDGAAPDAGAPADAGVVADAAGRDAGSIDAGAMADAAGRDAGSIDAGAMADAGSIDAVVTGDAGAPDATADAGVVADAVLPDAVALADAGPADAAAPDAAPDAGQGPMPQAGGSSPGNVQRSYDLARDGGWRATRWVRGAGDRELVLDTRTRTVLIDSAYGEGATLTADDLAGMAADDVRRAFGDEVLEELRDSLAAFS